MIGVAERTPKPASETDVFAIVQVPGDEELFVTVRDAVEDCPTAVFGKLTVLGTLIDQGIPVPLSVT